MKLLILSCLLSLQAFAGSASPKAQVHVKIVNAVAMSASLNSTAMDLSEYNASAVTAVWSSSSGSPTGDFKIQVSNDTLTSGQTCANVVNWTDLSGSTVSITDDGDAGWNFGNLGYRCLRLRFVRTSGTATLNVYFHAKAA